MSGTKAPEYQIQCLINVTSDNFHTKTTKETFDRVAFSLKKYGLKWNKAFGDNSTGPNAMVKAMRACIEKIQYTRKKVDQDGDEREEKQANLYDVLGAGMEAFKNYLSLGWNFNSLKEALAKDMAEVAIDVLNILFWMRDERSTKIKPTCAILLFGLAMPNENKSVQGEEMMREIES